MQTLSPPLATPPRAAAQAMPPDTWRTLARVFAINLLAWGVLSAMGAASSFSQMMRNGSGASYSLYFFGWWRCTFAQVLLSTALYMLFLHRPALVARPRRIALLYLALVLVFFPLDVMYEASYNIVLAGRELHAGSLLNALLSIHKIDWFIDFSLMSGAYGTQVALCIWRQNKAHQRDLERARTDNLRLELELERLRMLGLRAQLEPHFMFNALNAISALVRSDDKKVALSGIGRLSALLRYALSAGERDWVSIEEELAFVQDYLALQQLRYGARLRVTVEGVDAAIGAVPCPPLLLQPLLENALRHDLDCHDQASDIRVDFRREGEGEHQRLRIRICNPVTGAQHANPGLGLGLRHTQGCLQLAFGAQAALDTRREHGRFVVELHLPMAGPA